MFGRPELTLGQRYPQVWERVREAEAGEFETAEGLWSFATIQTSPLGGPGAVAEEAVPALVSERAWKLIHLIPRSELDAALFESRMVFGGMTSLLLLALLAGAWRVASSMQAEAWAKQALERSNLELERRVHARTRELSNEVEARRRSEAELEYQATHDTLTGLANRAQMEVYFEQAVAAASAGEGPGRVALAFLDLDNFKVINDSLGHGLGDELLTCVAQRLTHAARQSDLVARYGGDEFVLILECPPAVGDLEAVLGRILHSLEPPVMLGRHPVKVSCSVGVALYPEDGQDWNTLLRAADMALYKAKDGGKGRFQLYSRDLDRASQARFSYESALRGGLERGEVTAHFQPKLDVEGRLSGFEALARWDSPELGQVPPDRFIPVAESSGLILPLGWHVLRVACAEAAGWPAVGDGPPPSIAVNLSPKQLAAPELREEIQRALAESGLPPARLELEITESMLMGDIHSTIRVLGNLRAMGVSIAVDDFGTGYSSLSYLRRLPLDVLKIDRSFVDECDRSGEFMAIPHAIIFIGKTLKLRIVAEGVERREQFEVLQLCGCDEFQGYLISKPLAPEEARQFIANGVGRAQERLGLAAPRASLQQV
jgi:diguanylate cyclase (GGDEF)-like protein